MRKLTAWFHILTSWYQGLIPGDIIYREAIHVQMVRMDLLNDRLAGCIGLDIK